MGKGDIYILLQLETYCNNELTTVSWSTACFYFIIIRQGYNFILLRWLYW